MRISKGALAAIIIVAVILADQILKIWVKTHFYISEDLPITSWFHLKFIENNGMAFGLELWNKLVLTFGRILAVGFFLWFIIKAKAVASLRKGFIIAASLITAGAAGNIFDCVFYGVIFSNPFPPELAQLLPPDGGYSTWFEGRVVDMLYFPFFTINIGGHQWEFFQYIFNIADASICVGVALLALFYTKDLSTAWHAIFPSKKAADASPASGDTATTAAGNDEAQAPTHTPDEK